MAMKSMKKVRKVMKSMKKGSKVMKSMKEVLKKPITSILDKVKLRTIVAVKKTRPLALPPSWDPQKALTIHHVILNVENKKNIWLPVTAVEQINRVAPVVYSVDSNNKPVKGTFGENPWTYMDWTHDLEEALKTVIQFITFLKGGTAARVSPLILIWHHGSGHHRVPV